MGHSLKQNPRDCSCQLCQRSFVSFEGKAVTQEINLRRFSRTLSCVAVSWTTAVPPGAFGGALGSCSVGHHVVLAVGG